MNLSAHFTLEELTHSEVATRKGLDNTPTPEIEANLTELANALERVREILGVPLIISSAYRSVKVNAAIGGVATSAHCQGWAADFIAPQFGTPKEIALAILASDMDWDQLIWEFGAWVHFSISPQHRQQALTATMANGKASYANGIG